MDVVKPLFEDIRQAICGENTLLNTAKELETEGLGKSPTTINISDGAIEFMIFLILLAYS